MLAYNGMLQARVANDIKDMSKIYSYVLEMESLPANLKECLIDYSCQTEDCMGNLIVYKTKNYAIVYREKGEPFFLFLKTQKEKDSVVQKFSNLIINENPLYKIFKN